MHNALAWIRALGGKISVSLEEDLSRRTRDARQELRKYMRDVRKGDIKGFTS